VTFNLALLATAAAAAIAFGMSFGVFIVSYLCSRALDALSPAARARLLLCLSFLPGLATLALMTAAMAPAFGWIADHCALQADLHHSHPHLCADHDVLGLPAISVMALATVFLSRFLLGGVLVLQKLWVAVAAQNALDRASSWDPSVSVRVVPLAEPQAFVVGMVSPTVYVTRGLLALEHRAHLAPVLAHERAHVLRGDPLKRLFCQIGLVFHLPGIALWLERQLATAQEMAADAQAAAHVGSGERVALALVHLTRARSRVPQLVLPFRTGDLESRVRRLLLPPSGYDFPRPLSIFGAGFAAAALVALSADGVHHGVEMLLGLFGG
jgi:Zn-dependent protease with chaperone function